ncbi:MAG TPA: NAD(P)/FAD-dependent oxidoreductase [Candidatus Binatia bacterium]|jgi:NADH dehydrogenase|nr:NAD(P)/FAD-dependent oxidoreductase [Candidatus Binatia bacterium]
MPTPTKPSVVILGAGFGGAAAAHELADAARGAVCRVTVIDRNESHLFTPLLYEAATGFVEHENLGSAKLLAGGVTVRTADMLSPWGVDFVNGDIEGIDWDARRVLLRNAEPVAFDSLVIALGAETNFFGIAGLKENAFTLKSIRDADRLRQRIHDVLHKLEMGKDEDGKLNILIGGGGATGVELAAEVTFFLRRHLMKGHLKFDDFSVTLVEAQSRLLGALSPELSAKALERLKDLGVKVYLDSAVKEAAMKYVTLVPRACKPGETLDQLVCDFRHEGQKIMNPDIVVWTGGIRGSATLEKLGLPLDQRGKRIEVGSTLEVPGKKDVFALGDSVVLMDPKTKQPVPWLAQAAMKQGQVAAKTIKARLSGGADAKYDFPSYPVIVPLGAKYAIAIVGKIRLIGFWGWMLKEVANLRYFLSILPPIRAVQKWWHGALMYTKND